VVSALPLGWVEVPHPSTGQVVFERRDAATGETIVRRWTRPTKGDDGTDMHQALTQGDQGGGGGAPVKFSLGGSGGRKRSQAADNEGGGGDGKKKKKAKEEDGSSRAFAWQKSRKIDPMDPLGEEQGRNSAGTNNPGERMADSTASGPLWQQRPYPAPGSVLRGGKKK